MSPLEAKKIIGALANGIDPDTGEILPDQSIFNSPKVIRALYVAIQALERAVKRDEHNRSLPDNAGRSWSEKEDKELLDLFDSNVPIKDIAKKHGRTQGAVIARLLRHGRIKKHTDTFSDT